MQPRILSTIGWKAGAALAAIVLGAGVAGASTIVPTLISDDQTPAVDTTVDESTTTTVADEGATTTTTEVADEDATTTTTEVADEDATTTTTEVADEADDGAEAEGDDPEHPDNFGAIVSEDAHDGGVDGHEISDMAHERNAERRGESSDDAEDDSTTSTTEATADSATSTSSGPGHSGAHRP